MNEAVTQARLSMRMETYRGTYTSLHRNTDALSKTEWNTAWQLADGARTQNTLTPELVDDVRKALKKLETPDIRIL